MKKKLLTILLSVFMIIITFTANVFADGEVYVAQIGETKYATLQEAIGAVQDGDQIALLDDVTIDSEIIIPDGKTFTIDLNSKTLTTTAVTGFKINSANLTVKNGTVKNTNTSGTSATTMETRTKAFFLWKDGTGSLTLNGVKIESTGYSINVDNNNNNYGAKNKKIIIKDCEILSDKWAAVYAGGADNTNELTITNSTIHSSWTTTTMAALQICMKTTLEKTTVKNEYGAALACFENVNLLVKGTENSFSAPKEAIATSGNFQGSNITIEGGTFTSSSDIAAYLPGGDTVTINGGTFTGNTAVAIKGGNVAINGGTFTANGAATDPSSGESSGAKLTGDAIYVEDNYGNTGKDGAFFPHNVTLNINGGTFTSQNGYALSARFVDNDTTDPAQIDIKGGLFKCGIGKATIYTDNSFEGNITAFAGYYSVAPETKYIASNYECIDTPLTDDNHLTYPYMIGEKPKVAQIGDDKYYTLADAIAAVPTDGTKTIITMINNETIYDNQMQIAANQNIVLDLNGKTISGSCNEKPNGYSDYALLRNAGILFIKDSASDGKITNSVTYSPGNLGGYYTVLNSGKMTLESGTIEDTSEGVGGANNKLVWALTTVDDSDLTITGGLIIGSYNPIRIYYDDNNAGPDVTINGGELKTTDRFSVIDVQIGTGGTSLAPKGNIKITGGTFYTSKKTSTGGGNVSLYVDVKPNDVNFSELKFSISGGKFYSQNCTNFEEYDGGTTKINMCAKYIYGGLFSYVVPAAQIADGYECLTNNDNTTKADYPYIVVKKIQESDLDHRETNTVTNNSGKSVDTTFGTDVIVDPTLSVTDKNKITNISVSNLNKAISSTEKNNTINAAANGLNAESNKVEVDILMNVDITTIDAIKSLSEKIESEKGSVCDINNDVEFIDISINKIVKANGSVIEASLIKTTDSYQLITFPLIDILGENVNPENVFVYRNHVDNEGNETNTLFTKVEASYGPNYGGECYWIDGSSLIIKAKNFSVYGIGQQSTAIPAEQAPAPTPNPSSSPKSSYVVPKTGIN